MNYNKYFDILKKNCLDSRIHGFNHAVHVHNIASEILKHYPGVNKEVIFLASIFHDTKRSEDGIDKEHSDRSAKWFSKRFKTKNKLISQIIKQHNKDINNPCIELKILKDADCLSRVRFDGFDPKYLLFKDNWNLVGFAKDNWIKLNHDKIDEIFESEYNKAIAFLEATKNIMPTHRWLLDKRGLEDLKDFVNNRCLLPDHLYWQYLRAWLSYNYHKFVIETLKALLKDRKNPLLMMNKGELDAYYNLPGKLTVYRGCSTLNKDGLSWSLNKNEALRYTEGVIDGSVISKQINKSDIISYFLDHEKNEILLKNT